MAAALILFQLRRQVMCLERAYSMIVFCVSVLGRVWGFLEWFGLVLVFVVVVICLGLGFCLFACFCFYNCYNFYLNFQ